MLISTFSSDYIVTSIKKSNDEKEVYTCKRRIGAQNREYTVVKLKNMKEAQPFVEYFSKNVNKEEFEDFVECFTFENNLYFVYLNHRAPSIKEGVLKVDHKFIERLEIGKNLISKLVFLNMPYAIACSVINEERIMVDEDLHVYFDYDFCDINATYKCTIRDVARYLLGVMNTIFEREVELNSCDEINEFFSYLVEGKYETYIDFLSTYNEMYKILKERPEEELKKPRTWWYVTWEKTKFVLKKLKVVFMCILVIGALVYLGWTIMEKLKPSTVTGKEFASIGELEIEQ